MWRYIRIAILLFVLASVAQTAWLARTRSAEWKTPLRVAIYPSPGDDSDATRKYIAGLDKDAFASLEEFFGREAAKYSIALTPPVEIAVAPALAAPPPAAPSGGNAAQVVF